jgi:PilZ domain
MANDKNYSEKRDFIRMKISAPLGATLTTPVKTIEGMCRDLSGGGMQVETKEALTLGTELEVEISSSHGHNPTLKAKVKVARVQEVATNDYLIGLEILNLID